MKVVAASVLVLALGSPVGAQQVTTPSVNVRERGTTLGFPSLFTPLTRVARKTAVTAAMPVGVESMQRVALDSSVLGLGAFAVNVEGRDFIAERVDSRLDIPSEKFVYRTGSDEALSTFTKFADGTVLAKVFAGGKGYFVTPEGDHYLVVRSAHRVMPEVMHSPLIEIQEKVTLAGTTTGCAGKCRAVRFPYPPAPTLRIVVAMENKYADAVGGRAKAIDRTTHWRDRQNTAYQQSGFEGRVEVPEFAFFDLPEDLSKWGTVYAWATDPANPVIRDMRRRNAAGAVVIFSTSTYSNEAARSSPDPAFMNFDSEVAVVGGFYATWSDDDIWTAIHEVGHVSGGDHNIEDAAPQATDPQGSARDWYDCASGVRGALSYNRCNAFLEDAEIYSGVNSFWNNSPTGKAGVNDNVAMFRLVFKLLQGKHD
jgi:hypothetical protein